MPSIVVVIGSFRNKGFFFLFFVVAVVVVVVLVVDVIVVVVDVVVGTWFRNSFRNLFSLKTAT